MYEELNVAFAYFVKTPFLNKSKQPIQPKPEVAWKRGLRALARAKLKNHGGLIFREDIPCSSVRNGEDVSKWTIPQLKFWLKCRRLNQQELKKDLVEK